MNPTTKLTVLIGSVLLLTALVALNIAAVSAAPGPDLVIDKWVPGPEDDVEVAIAGEELIYEISVRNQSADAAPEVSVTDYLPSQVTYIDDTDACSLTDTDPDQLECYLGDMGAWEYRTFQVKVRVDPDAVADQDDGTIVINNEAIVESSETDDDDSNNIVTHSMFVEDSADLLVVKMSKPDTHVRAGEPFSYTIFVENLGPSWARNVSIRDEIVLEPFGDAHIVSVNTDNPGDICNWQETAWGYTILCNRLGPLAVKDAWSQGRWTIQVEMEGDETQDVNNVVNVFTDPELGTADPDLSNNLAEDFIYVTDVADLSVSKYHDGCWHDGVTSSLTCFAGGHAQFDLVVQNYGPSTAENVVVQDLLPPGVTVLEVYFSEGSGSCTTGIPGDPFAPLTCNLGNLPPGGYSQVTINVRFDPDYVDAELPSDYRTLENDAWVYSDIFDPDNSNNRDHVIVDVGTLSELAITKWGFPAVAGVGAGVEYEIRIRNSGPSTADMVHFVDLLPPTVDYEDYFIEQGTGTCTYHEYLPWPWWEEFRGVHCYVDEIPPNGIVMVHLLGTYNEELWWADQNEACNVIPDDDPFSGVSDQTGVDDPWPMPGWFADSRVRILWENSPLFDDAAFGWCPDDVYVEADLSIEKTSEPMKLYPGEQKTYHIEVTNNGPTGAPGVMVTDTLPISVTYEIDNGECELVGSDPDVLECELGNMMPGETKSFDVWALVHPDTPPGEITNEACVSMEAGDDPNEENNCDSATNLVLEPIFADLELAKSVASPPPPPFDAGEDVEFQLLVTNHGPVAAENVVLEDMLPEGVTVLEVHSGPDSCTTGIPGSEPLRCNLGALAPTASQFVEVIVRIDPNYMGSLENDAVVSSDIYDPDNSNNRDYVILDIGTWSDVFMKKGCGWEEDVLAGEQIQYDILVRNDGPSTLHNYEIWDLLPDDVTFLSYEMLPGGGECFYTPQLPPMHGGPGQGLHCYLGDIAPTDTRILYVRVRVNPDAPEGLLTNEISDYAADSVFGLTWPSDLYCENNVINNADLSIRKTADPYKVYAGEQVRYDISVTNNGPGIAYNVVVSDTLDPGVEFEISTADCDYSPPTMLGATPPDAPYTLFSVDLGSGAGSYIGDTPDEWLAAEIEYDNTTGRLFAAQGFRPWDGDGIAPRLYELDPETGDSLGYVELEEDCALPGLEFVDGTLYGACSYDPGDGPDLYTIDPDTGDMVKIGDTLLDDLIHGLAYDESSGIMYGLEAGDGRNELWEIDLVDGDGDWLCDIVEWDFDHWDDVYDLRSIEFGPDGVLYGGMATEDTDLVRIEISEYECEITPIGDTGYRVTGLTLMEGSGDAACHLGEIPPGETSTFSIWARVKPHTLGVISNRVDVYSDTADPNPDNDWDTEASLVLGKADLMVTKFGKPDGEVRAGDSLEYWVIVDNLGPGFAHEVVLYDLLASDEEIDIDWWESDRPADCWEDSYDQGETRLTCRLDDPLEVMSPSSSGRWVLKVWVDVYEDGSINNVAHVVSSDFDPDPSNNQAIAEHDITAVADLELSKEAWGEVLVGCEGETDLWENEVAAGGMLEYTLEIYNEGPSEAENVVVEDWGLSPFLDIVDVGCEKDDDSEECSCNTTELGELGDENRRLVCYLGTIEEDDEDKITILARIPSDVPEGIDLLKNDARVYADVFDDDNGDNLATNWTTVSRWADLDVLKTQDPEIALPGWDITYSVTVTNLGLSDAEGVFISDTIPVQVLNPQWTCCASDDGECDVPCEPPVCPEGPCEWPDPGLFAQADIPAGEWVIYTITGTLDWWPCGPFTNTVEVIAPPSLVHEGDDIDPCDENNTDIAVNDPMCHFEPLVLKGFPGPDSTD
jgi:uncharacterized repeat protein (TIGR01451 family)